MEKRLWVKICGTTSLADAALAVEAGADAVGFVFAPSPRRVSPVEAARIVARVSNAVQCYGVFVHPSFEQVVETVRESGLSGVQLHATEDPLLFVRLREHFGASPEGGQVSLVRVLRLGPEQDEELDGRFAAMQRVSTVEPVLVDAYRKGAEGGTGLSFDWTRAQTPFRAAASHLRLIAAGGLTPANVGEAVAILNPWGVDVVTGVEASPGRKDPEKVRDFVQSARAAARASLGRQTIEVR